MAEPVGPNDIATDTPREATLATSEKIGSYVAMAWPLVNIAA